MPDRPLAVATYAAGASLAAITLVYVFGPSLFTDSVNVFSGRHGHKNGVVGLRNPANDCFINAGLQTLAGLPTLRLYLVQELYKRLRDGDAFHGPGLDTDADDDKYVDTSDDRPRLTGPAVPVWMQVDRQLGMVTKALKEILDELNARPISKKTISARSFISTLERAFRTRLSRNQQDAQEFLQIVIERLLEEYQAGEKVREKLKDSKTAGGTYYTAASPDEGAEDIVSHNGVMFPFEGKTESTITCSHCSFVPKPTMSYFTILTLHVAQQSSTSLDSCFDSSFMVEHIDDYRCDRCYLRFALELKQRQLLQCSHGKKSVKIAEELAALELALATDPESPPSGIDMPPFGSAPKRRVARSSRISAFPKILAIHLSRSVWSSNAMSTKNLARVTFEEHISLGGLLDRVQYRLLGVITHHGGHNSGHYESLRRQNIYSDTTGETGLGSRPRTEQSDVDPTSTRTANSAFPSEARTTATDESSSAVDQVPCQEDKEALCPDQDQHNVHKSDPINSRDNSSREPLTSTDGIARFKNNLTSRINKRTAKREQERWWRISDDKVRECNTQDVLSLQKEVYMLFYERVSES